MRALDVLLGDLKEALCGGGDAEDTLPFPAAGELPQLYLPDGVSSWDMPLAQQFSGKRYVFSPNLFEITGMQFQFGAEDSLRLEVAGESTELKIGAGIGNTEKRRCGKRRRPTRIRNSCFPGLPALVRGRARYITSSWRSTRPAMC